ncbi:Katanin p80 WD40 repeat-containing subunit B1 [Homalodisca vitripennis]|nr:Katanin p80 WD40 repeat-containing subunit B1 [Homalodisca vitripennis]
MKPTSAVHLVVQKHKRLNCLFSAPRYMTVGADALKLILHTFTPVIKSNVLNAAPTVGVDISREERYKKCIKCYNSLVTIRTFLLKRQTMQGKLGHTFRELHILLQALDSH